MDKGAELLPHALDHRLPSARVPAVPRGVRPGNHRPLQRGLFGLGAASALLMLLTTQQWERLGVVPIDMIRADPLRIAQGTMTGIGFLGAGVIFKEGLTVRAWSGSLAGD